MAGTIKLAGGVHREKIRPAICGVKAVRLVAESKKPIAEAPKTLESMKTMDKRLRQFKDDGNGTRKAAV